MTVGPTDRGVKGPRPVRAGRRERRRPDEAMPLCETRRWTRLFRKFTGGAWERQAPPRGNPSGTTPPAGRGRTRAIHPAALSRLLRGVASRDQPQGNPLGSRRWTRLFPGVGHGSLPCAATAQPTKQARVAGAPLPFVSTWGPSRWLSGRLAPRLGPRGPGSFPSALASHGTRTGRRSAGADPPACLDPRESRLRRGTDRCRHSEGRDRARQGGRSTGGRRSGGRPLGAVARGRHGPHCPTRAGRRLPHTCSLLCALRLPSSSALTV